MNCYRNWKQKRYNEKVLLERAKSERKHEERLYILKRDLQELLGVKEEYRSIFGLLKENYSEDSRHEIRIALEKIIDERIAAAKTPKKK